MTLQREFFAGARDGFGFKIAFHPDPEKGAGATREELLSWGSFEIWVNGQDLCSHLEEGASVPAVHWYLLPLLEWLVANWDFLLHEERLPARNVGRDAWTSLFQTAEPPPGLTDQATEAWETQWHGWWRRHCLLACRDGGLFPDVFIRRWQDWIEVSWGPARLAGAPAHHRFEAGQGFARFAPDEVARALFDVLLRAGQHLLELAPDSERFRQLVKDTAGIQRADAGRRVALLAGLGTRPEDVEASWREAESLFPRNLDEQIREAVLGQTADGLVIRGSCQAALMFGSVSPTIDREDAALAVREVGDEIDSPDQVLAIARRLRTSFTATLEHLTNLNFMQEVVRDRIRLAFEQRATSCA